MPFPTKDWKNAPSAETPLTAEALEDLEARLAAYTDAAVASVAGTNNVISFNRLGILTLATGTARIKLPRGFTIGSISASVRIAPVGTAVVIDINRNGVTLFTNQLDRPTIAAGAFDSAAKTPAVVNLAAGDVLTVDIDEAPTGTNVATDLLVLISGRFI